MSNPILPSAKFLPFLLTIAFGIVAQAGAAEAQEGMQPGEAFVTRFSGTVPDGDRRVINLDGAVGSIVDLRSPGGPPRGEHWWNEPQRSAVTARDVGQVFGVALDEASPPNVYLTATSAFGLHRNAENTDWMPGLWGSEGGPGTVYRLSAANDYGPQIFARIAIDGRTNTGAALGNIAFDRWNGQLFVSDLETGMIHRLRLSDGFDLGAYDHGVTGRPGFFDARSGETLSLDPVALDPAISAQIDDCPTGDVARTPSCWNFADFRRRVWGVAVRRDPLSGEVRLYYALWGSQGFGHPGHAGSGDERRNSVWSVGLTENGDFDTGHIRREFVLPDFFRSPEQIARSGFSHPVTDIAFPAFGDQAVMLLAERGGVRNLGLDAENAFSRPSEARVLRYELDNSGVWQPAGRYDVGYYDRQGDGPPYIRAGAAGGVAFGMGYGDNWEADPGRPDAFVWVTGDRLCSPQSLCFDGSAGEYNDSSEVHGLQGRPAGSFEELEPDGAFRPYPTPGPATPADGPNGSFMIDTDTNVDETGGGVEEELARNDATRIGDVEVYQTRPDPAGGPSAGIWYGPWEESWPWPVPLPEEGYPPLPMPPPGEAWPELAIEKMPARCETSGHCVVTIAITNRGTGAYAGPLHVLEAPDHGLLMETVTPGWTCEQPVPHGTIGCRSDAVTLAPGDRINLRIALGWMFAFADEPPEFVERRNCAFIVWPGALGGTARIRAVEAALLLAGYATGPVDGIIDPATAAAINDYRADIGLAPGGIDAALLATLFPGTSGMPGDGVPENDWDCAPIIIELPVAAPVEGPDLAVEKSRIGDCAVVAGGQICVFRIAVSNVGTADFEGPIEVSDRMTGGTWMRPIGDLLGHGWTCDPLGPPPDRTVVCTVPTVALAAGGGRTEFAVPIYLPDPVDPATLEDNCAELSGPADDPNGNNRDCADFTGAEEEAVEAPDVDLSLAKFAVLGGLCEPGATCDFRVWITNNGADDYRGRPVIRDRGGSASADLVLEGPFESLTPGVTCHPGPEEYSLCEYDDEVTIPAGGFISFDVRAPVPADAIGQRIGNCVWIEWDAMTFPGGHDAVPGNDDECFVRNLWDLGIEKQASGACYRTRDCLMTITVTNHSARPYEGTIHVDDTHYLEGAAVRPQLVSWAPSEWHCEDVEGRISCDRPDSRLLPDESTSLRLTLRFGNPGEHTDIAEVSSDWTHNPENDTAEGRTTILTWTPEGTFDFRVAKTGPDLCLPGTECLFNVTIANEGPDTHGGRLEFLDIVYDSSGALLESVTPGPARSADSAWSCIGAAGRSHCDTTTVDFRAGFSSAIEMPVTIPADYTGEYIENCSYLTAPLDSHPGGNEACARVRTQLAADLGVEAHVDGECIPGGECTIVITIEHESGAVYTGELGLGGTVSPEDILAGIEALDEGWVCELTGESTFECVHNPLTLPAGGNQTFRLRLQVPKNPNSDQASVRTEIFFPAGRNEINDKNNNHMLTIPLPTPQPETLPAPDLAIDKVANQGSCIAGQTCGFSVTVENAGQGAFVGPIRLTDIPVLAGTRFASVQPAPWACRPSSGRLSCTHPSTTLEPGESLSLSLNLVTRPGAGGELRNCAEFDWRSDARVYAVQAALNALGIEAGPVDGKAGSRTGTAVRAYQERSGLAATGRIDDELMENLFGAWGSGDGNTGNDRDCADAALEPSPAPSREEPAGVTPIPVPAPCTGGRVRDIRGYCVCPPDRPLWNGSICVARAAPPACPSGWRKVTRSKAKDLVQQGYEIRQVGDALCARREQVTQPPAQQKCTSGRIRDRQGKCVCPANRPVWNGRVCIARAAPPSCPSGWQTVTRSKAKDLVQQGYEIRQVGEALCARRRQVTTPPAQEQCTGGRIRDKQGKCVCPANRPVWNGKRCVQRIRIGPTLVPRL